MIVKLLTEDISNNVVYATNKGLGQPARTHAHKIRAFASRLTV